MSARRISVLGAALSGQVDIICACPPMPFVSRCPLLMPLKKPCLPLPSVKRQPISQLCLDMVGAGYVREERVEGPGQFAVRGGIVDVYPVGMEHPVRVEFFDDEVDALRSFDVMTQRSIDTLRTVAILPAGECPIDNEAMAYGLSNLKSQVQDAIRRLKRLDKTDQTRRHENTRESVALLTQANIEKPWERLQRRLEEWEASLASQGRFEGNGEPTSLFLSCCR